MQSSTIVREQRIWIYCDGGFGNRLNALFSGLALAQRFALRFTIMWPRNNWCQAGFSDIFSNPFEVDGRLLSELAGQLGDMVPLLNDQLGADAIRVGFNSAYAYTSLDDFGDRVVATGKDVFFYPALMPQWIPQAMVVEQMRRCQYVEGIQNAVREFLRKDLKCEPYYGLHLRRTDLGVGYSDDEVRAIVTSHPRERFFVCSDDPQAEALAAVWPNVMTRGKRAYVGKRNDGGEWTAATADDDGRVYHSNIDRSSESVIEAVIDLLLLAHGEIVGFSGSTFQNIARMYGEHAPLVAVHRPSHPIQYQAMNTLERMLKGGTLGLEQCANHALQMGQVGEVRRAIYLEQLALEQAAAKEPLGMATLLLHYNLGAHLINDARPYEAACYLQSALLSFPAQPQLQSLLETATQRGGFARPGPATLTGSRERYATFMQWHLGDNLIHLHFLRRLAQRYPEAEFTHGLNPAYMAQCQEVVADLPRIRLVPLDKCPANAIDAWKGTDGFFFSHPKRFQFGALYLDLFDRMARKMGMESPFETTADLLFDYPAICRNQGLGRYDVLLVNSVPLSEQFKSYQESDFVALAQAMRARGLSVITTKAIAGFPCSLDANLSVTAIANLSLRARYFVAVCTGAMWTSMNIFNQSIHEFKVILNDHETVDIGENITMCRSSHEMVPLVMGMLDEKVVA